MALAPIDARVAALARMPMPTDIKQLRSLLGGLSYYRKFLPNMAYHIRPGTALLKKGVFTDHQCLQQICKIGDTEPRIQCWMEFLSACNFRLSYRRGQENANADFLSRLPLPPIADNVSGASALTDPDDLGVYIIRACGLTTPSCPVPGVGLGGLVPSPYIPVLGGLAPSPDISVLGGLPLTSDDFRTHRDLSFCDHSPSSPSRDLSPGTLHNLRH